MWGSRRGRNLVALLLTYSGVEDADVRAEEGEVPLNEAGESFDVRE